MTNLIKTERLDSLGNTNEIWTLYDSLPAQAKIAILVAKKAIIENRSISKRKEQIQKYKIKGVGFDIFAMGIGGVGQLKIVGNQVRFQISYGRSKYNYATCLVIQL